MLQFSKYVSILVVLGIFLLSASFLSAQQRVPTKAPQAVTPGQEGGKAGIIVVDGSMGSDPQSADQSQTRPGVAIEPGEIFQPRSPGIAIEPGEIFQPKPHGGISHEDISPGRQ